MVPAPYVYIPNGMVSDMANNTPVTFTSHELLLVSNLEWDNLGAKVNYSILPGSEIKPNEHQAAGKPKPANHCATTAI